MNVGAKKAMFCLYKKKKFRWTRWSGFVDVGVTDFRKIKASKHQFNFAPSSSFFVLVISLSLSFSLIGSVLDHCL